MNRIRSFAIGTVLLFALTTVAQQTTTSTSDSAKGEVATVEKQLKVLTEKLYLTGNQQAKIKPILQHLHDATVKYMADKSLSHEERLDKVRPLFYEADQKIRAVLNEDQKKKLDQFEKEPHPEMHGNLNGATQ